MGDIFPISGVIFGPKIWANRYNQGTYGQNLHLSRETFNRGRLPILLVVSLTGKAYFSLSLFALENLVERDIRPPRPASARSFFTQSESSIINHQSGAYSWDSFRFPRRRPHIPSTAIGSVTSLSGQANAYRWRSLPRVRRRRASSPQGSFCNGCCLCR